MHDAPTTSAPSTSHSLLKMLEPDALNLLLVRHGQASGHGIIPPVPGPALSDLGMEQAQHLAQRLAPLPLDYIYASDMARSYQTACAVSTHHPKTPFESLPDLREISGFQARTRPPARKAEDRTRMHEERHRVKRFAAHLRDKHKPGELVAVIAHNGLNGMLLASLVGVSYRQSICFTACHTSVAIANLTPGSGAVVLRLMGCTSHLPHELISHMNETPIYP